MQTRAGDSIQLLHLFPYTISGAETTLTGVVCALVQYWGAWGGGGGGGGGLQQAFAQKGPMKMILLEQENLLTQQQWL
jgi:hypothetical protein